MAGRQPASTARARGSITTLPSGTIRVRVYAGIDPVSGRRHYLTELVQPGKKAQREAEAVRARLLAQVEERRNPRTNATVDELVRRHLDQFAGAPNTLQMYRGHVKNHISPLLGRINIGRLDPEILDSFYAELRRCRIHCSGSGLVDHRTRRDHECDDRCRPHRCKPLSATTIRHIHFILSGAYKRAVRWRWVAVNPLAQAEPPPAPKSNPRPPSAEQAAQLLNKAWDDPDWGALIWTAMTTGARRGELCAVRWTWLNFEEGRETLWSQSGIRKSDDGWVEGDLKTHQQRRIALDAETVAVLTDLRAQVVKRAEMLGIELAPDAFVFSTAADGATFPTPDSVTQRYDRMAKKLGIVTTFHKLRHYSATELIVGGADPRTVAGRLGHGDGGTTTLKTYTAWVSEADQRAATGLGARMPERPTQAEQERRAVRASEYPYEHLADAIIGRVAMGELKVGQVLPRAEGIAAEAGVSLSTARRAIRLLKERGAVVSIGGRPTLSAVALSGFSRTAGVESTLSSATPRSELLKLSDQSYWIATVRGPGGRRFEPRVVRGSLSDSDSFRQAEKTARRCGIPLAEIAARPTDSATADQEADSRPGFGGLFRDYPTPTILLGLMSAVGLLLVYALNTWLPELMGRAGFSTSGSLGFLLVLNGGAVLGALFASRLADRFGPKRVVAGSFAVGAVAIVLMTIDLPLGPLLALVAVVGLGTSGTQILIYGFVATYYRTSVRSAGVAWCAGFGRLGGVGGPLVGGLMVASGLELDTIFYLLAALAVVGGLLSLVVPATHRPSVRQPATRDSAPTAGN